MSPIPELDAASDLAGAIEQASATGTALNVVAGGTKSFLGHPVDPAAPEPRKRLDLSAHSGILQYEPAELMLRARAGSRLADIEALLADHGQMLPFEPPHFGPGATLGGCVAAGLSGPRRASGGSVRDSVLGVTIINGQGEILSFGGQVMKNVAGYDVSRLMVGSMGTLAVILDVSLKVLPLPSMERTCVLECGGEDAIHRMCSLAESTHPVSATCYDGRQLSVRLSSTEAAVETAMGQIGGEQLEDQQRFWEELREQRNPFYESEMDLWRVSVPPATPHDVTAGSLLEWGGAQRWMKSDPEVDLRTQLGLMEGHMTLFRRRSSGQAQRLPEVFQPLSEDLMQIHRRLKKSFDPHSIFNPGRMFRDL
jgi:glycolate oxidase FAD binding subunit